MPEKQSELRNPRSCLNKAGIFEPIFVLRAKDPLAAQTVRLWASMAVNEHEPGKVDEAHQLAEEMDKWRKANLAPEPVMSDNRISGQEGKAIGIARGY